MKASLFILAALALATVDSATASIAGRVLDDHGRPVPGLSVAALQLAAGAASVVPGSRGSIDEHGAYRITNLPAGTFIVRTSIGTIHWSLPIPGIAPDARPLARDPRLNPISFVTDPDGEFAQFGAAVLRLGDAPFAYIPSFFGGATTSGLARPVNVSTGQTKSGIDITIRTVPAVTIQGTVTGPDGPIDDAAVRLKSDDWDTMPITTAFSGRGGRYRFVVMPRGHYTLTASRLEPPSFIVLTAEGYPQLPQNDAARSGTPMTVPVNATVRAVGADVVTVDVRMTSQVAMVWSPESKRRPEPPPARMDGAATLDGVVTNDLGEILPNVRVAIFNASIGGPRAAVTDEHGRFRFERLPASEFTLLATAPFSSTVEYQQPRAGAPGRKIAVRDRESRQIEVRIARPGAISGTIVDAAGAPVSTARVTASTDGDPVFGYTVTADDGRYRIAGLAPGEYVVVSNRTYAPGTSSLSEARRVVVAAGAELTDVDIKRIR